MKILDLGNWSSMPALCQQNLLTASHEATARGYEAASLHVVVPDSRCRNLKRRVTILVLAQPADDVHAPEHFINLPGATQRGFLFDHHRWDTARPAPTLPPATPLPPKPPQG